MKDNLRLNVLLQNGGVPPLVASALAEAFDRSRAAEREILLAELNGLKAEVNGRLLESKLASLMLILAIAVGVIVLGYFKAV